MKNNIWERAQCVSLDVSCDILPEFDVCFDKKIPLTVVKELKNFVVWLEDNYRFPITLLVDFEYKHYLISKDGKRVGYLFYWCDFTTYPVFDCKYDIPMIRLPVRTEHSSMEEILTSFIEGITDYYAWICNENRVDCFLSTDEADSILDKYLNQVKAGGKD